MNKLLLIATLLICFTWSHTYGVSFTAWKLPDRQDRWYVLTYQNFTTKVELQGLFYETTLSMKVKLGNSGISYTPPSGLYELEWYFELPTEVIITGCQIWDTNKNQYLDAISVDRSSAEAIYYADSTQSPKLLLRQYQYQDYRGIKKKGNHLLIASIQSTETVDIQLKWISPCIMTWNSRRIFILTKQFYSPYYNYNNDAPALLYFHDSDNPGQKPENISNISVSWQYQNPYWRAQAGPSSVSFYDNALLSSLPETNSNQFFQIWQDENDNLYQISTKPSISDQEKPARNIIIAMDLTGTNKNNIIDQLTAPLNVALSTKDFIGFATSNFYIQWLDSELQPYSTTLITTRLNELKNINPSINSLPFILRSAVDFLNQRNIPGEIWLISNDYQHGSAQTAMEIVNQTVYIAKNKIVFRIIDANTGGTYYTINNKSYTGNEYLYENLFRLTNGSMLLLKKLQSYDCIDGMIDCLGPTISSVFIDPLPTEGVCFSRIDLNRGRQNHNYMTRYFQMGLFEGALPFTLNYYGTFEKTLYQKEIPINLNPANPPDYQKKWLKDYWYGYYIHYDLLLQPQSFETIKYIEQISVQNSILSPYCSFVVPGPAGYVGHKRLSSIDTTKYMEENSDTRRTMVPKDFHIKVYPNPFNAQISISLIYPDLDVTEKFGLHIFNVLGQEILSKTIYLSPGMHSVETSWDGRDTLGKSVGSGIYIVLFRSGSKTVGRQKITLLR